ncbi:MAG: hypothetical protein PUK40_04495 [Actinomycetaceae bacterium]|nr:hypothetical protein [Arcanobacterium sp.]MDD7505192.1 hypothetical protein [Actinomycetaceae bacterium]MDY6144073.1 hypothetical protein [Arcanobacterium sp.]
MLSYRAGRTIIYDYVKAGLQPPAEEFYSVIGELKANGASAVITGCTELSIVHKDLLVEDPAVVDSLDALVRKTIVDSGHTLKSEE